MIVAILLFSVGIAGVISRRNIFVIYISLELMLNAINLMLITLSRYFASLNGQILAMMVVAVCAAEAALFLSLVVLMYKRKGCVDTDKFTSLSQNRDKHHE
ncbi:MAG: NADH-quinone oxidoreductase subunit NuoK [Epsilonproteobacteria bacterium]|nr:NADH-quinone oxidoreductase subunit NuoK [Campylobacterota bacterium]